MRGRDASSTGTAVSTDGVGRCSGTGVIRLACGGEARRGLAAPDDDGAAEMVGVVRRLRRIPGVRCAVAQLAYGKPIEDDGADAERLGRDTRYLWFLGKQLGALLEAGVVASASAAGASTVLLLFASEPGSIGVLAERSGAGAPSTAILDAIARLGWTTPGTDGPRQDHTRALGSMKCEGRGSVLTGRFRSDHDGAAQEAAAIVESAVAGLAQATGGVQTIALRYRALSLSVNVLGGGFSVEWEGPAGPEDRST